MIISCCQFQYHIVPNGEFYADTDTSVLTLEPSIESRLLLSNPRTAGKVIIATNSFSLFWALDVAEICLDTFEEVDPKRKHLAMLQLSNACKTVFHVLICEKTSLQDLSSDNALFAADKIFKKTYHSLARSTGGFLTVQIIADPTNGDTSWNIKYECITNTDNTKQGE